MFTLHLPTIGIATTTTFGVPKCNHLSKTTLFSSSLHIQPSLSYSSLGRCPRLSSKASSNVEEAPVLAEVGNEFIPTSAKAEVSTLNKEEVELPVGLKREAMPRHLAVIMDGNARWAEQRGLKGSAGHEEGVEALKRVMEMCGKWGIRILTIFAFSYDNWVRPQVSCYFLIRPIPSSSRVVGNEADSE